MPARPNIEDPRKFLQAAPELADFVDDPPVAEAIIAGDGKKLYAALRRLKKSHSVFSEEQLDALLRNRRLFLRPGKAPPLRRINGIGVGFYGASGRRPDGTYITTYCASFLWIPIFPLAQCLVTNEGRRLYRFLGWVPVSNVVRGLRAAIVCGVIVACGIGAATVKRLSKTSTVYFLNGLSEPVALSAGARHFEVPSDGKIAATLPVGPTDVVVRTPSGRVLEKQRVVVPSWTDVVAYDVAGVAPLYMERIRYGAAAISTERPRAHARTFVGRRFVTLDHVDDVFRTPPKTVDLPTGEDSTHRSHVGLLPNGWRGTYNLLSALHDRKGIALLIRNLLLAEPDLPEASALLRQLVVSQRSPSDVLALGDALVARWPKSVAAQILFQESRELTGNGSTLSAIYHAHLEQSPHSALWGYLYARIAPEPEAASTYRRLTGEFPRDPHLQMGWADLLFARGKAVDAASHYESAAKLKPEWVPRFRTKWIRALILSGQMKNALRLARETPPKSPLWNLLVAEWVERLAHAPDQRGPAHFARELMHRPLDRALLYVLAGAKVPSVALTRLAKEDQAVVRLTRLLLEDPTAAALAVPTVTDDVLARFDPECAILLFCECLRLGKSKAADRIAAFAPELDRVKGTLRGALSGKESEAFTQLSWALRASAHLIRVHSLPRKSRERARLLALARKENVLAGPVISIAQKMIEGAQ